MKRGSQLLYPPPKYGQISSIWRLLCLDQLSLLRFASKQQKILNKLHPIWIENLFIDSAERMPVKSAPHSKTTSLSTSLSSTRQPLFPRSLVSNTCFLLLHLVDRIAEPRWAPIAVRKVDLERCWKLILCGIFRTKSLDRFAIFDKLSLLDSSFAGYEGQLRWHKKA